MFGSGHVKMQTADHPDCADHADFADWEFFKINLLFFSFFYLGFLKECLQNFLLFAMPIDSWKPGMVLEKFIINVLAVRNSRRISRVY